MATRRQLKGVKKHRKVGHRPHKSKKSVAERRRLRLLDTKLYNVLLKAKNTIESIY